MNGAFQRATENAEPKAALTSAPIALIVLFALLFYGAAYYLNDHGGGFSAKVYQPYRNFAAVDASQILDPTKKYLQTGKLVFHNNCEVCHMPTGLGQPGLIPPLAGSEWVNNPSPHRIIRGVLKGITGPITVSGKPFNNTMVPWESLSDEQIGAALSFVRQNKEWGNSAPVVTPQQVKTIRDKIADRKSSFTSADLEKLPEDK